MAPPSEENGNGHDTPMIKFTVKEMFDQIQRQLIIIDTKLEKKVDQSDFLALEARSSAHHSMVDRKIAVFDALHQKDLATLATSRYRWPFVLSIVYTVTCLLAIVLSLTNLHL